MESLFIIVWMINSIRCGAHFAILILVVLLPANFVGGGGASSRDEGLIETEHERLEISRGVETTEDTFNKKQLKQPTQL